MKNKSGLSTIITTLIIILLVLALIIIFWIVIKNFIIDSSENVDLGRFTVDLDIKNAYIEGDDVIVRVRRNPGKGNLIGMIFIFEATGENDEKVRVDEAIPELGERILTIPLSEMDASIAEKVFVAPIYETESGKEVEGNILDSYRIGDAPEYDCQAGDTQQCGVDIGLCQSDTQTCIGGFWSACNDIGPVAEICGDGIDQDCDGSDEVCLIPTRSYYPNSTGSLASWEYVAGDGGNFAWGTCDAGSYSASDLDKVSTNEGDASNSVLINGNGGGGVGVSVCQSIRFNISEEVGNITQIDVIARHRGEVDYGIVKDLWLYIGNVSSSGWKGVGGATSASVITIYNQTATITSSISDYINDTGGDKYVYVQVHLNGTESIPLGGLLVHTLYFIEVNITSAS